MSSLAAEMPVFIPAFNNPTYVRNMLAQLSCRGIRNTIVIDNGSTAPGMQDCMLEAGRVIHLDRNGGPRYLFRDESEFAALPQFFCVTDPDLELGRQLPDNFLAVLAALTEEFQIGKAGFALDISEPAELRTEYFRNGCCITKIWQWEKQYWKDQVASTLSGDPIYRADIDTTFAVYNRKYYREERHQQALRLAGRYTCRHLPWYRNSDVDAAEAAYYAATQKYSTYCSPIPGGERLIWTYRRQADRISRALGWLRRQPGSSLAALAPQPRSSPAPRSR